MKGLVPQSNFNWCMGTCSRIWGEASETPGHFAQGNKDLSNRIVAKRENSEFQDKASRRNIPVINCCVTNDSQTQWIKHQQSFYDIFLWHILLKLYCLLWRSLGNHIAPKSVSSTYSPILLRKGNTLRPHFSKGGILTSHCEKSTWVRRSCSNLILDNMSYHNIQLCQLIRIVV